MRFATASAALIFLTFTHTASAQPNAACEKMIGKSVTATGTIAKIVEFDDFMEIVVFNDTKTGCWITSLEILLDETCRPGKAIVMTGTFQKAALGDGYEVDRGENPAQDTLICR